MDRYGVSWGGWTKTPRFKNSPFSENHSALKFPFPDSEFPPPVVIWALAHLQRAPRAAPAWGVCLVLIVMAVGYADMPHSLHPTHPVCCPWKKMLENWKSWPFLWKGGRSLHCSFSGESQLATTFLPDVLIERNLCSRQLHSSLPATVFRHHLLLPLEVGR